VVSPADLKQWHVVDLTHPLAPDMPVWPGDPPFEQAPWTTYEKTGYLSHRFSIGDHGGTHWGTPNTVISGGRSADQFSADDLVLPAAVIDIRVQAAANADHRLSVADITAWERINGRISAGSLVILFTGWQDRWKNPRKFLGPGGTAGCHWPGFAAATVDFLVHTRKIRGLGTDTHGADPGTDKNLSASRALYHADGIILECLTRLDQLPATGATVVIGGLPLTGSTGSPARVFAFLPPP